VPAVRFPGCVINTDITMALTQKLYDLIEGSGSASRKGVTWFNRVVFVVIVISLIGAVLETEYTIYSRNPGVFRIFSVIIGIFFFVEYLLRVYAAKADPRYQGRWGRVRYLFSFWAIVDFIAVLPLFLTTFDSTPFLARMLRMLRILRIFKMGRYSDAFDGLKDAVLKRRFELFVATSAAVLLLFLSATGLYVTEAGAQPESFGSIPRAMWWSVATLTTVGYGDTTPITVVGKVLAGFTAMAGIGLIAIPTGILAAAFSEAFQKRNNNL
jgi:voltage-gated potassium channel